MIPFSPRFPPYYPHQPTSLPPPSLPALLLLLHINVQAEMNCLCWCLQTVEGWTPNKVIKAGRMAPASVRRSDVDGRGHGNDTEASPG